MDASQAGAASEGFLPDSGDGLALDGIRDHQFARGWSFTIGDGDLDVSRGVNKVAEVSSVKWQNCRDTDSKKGLAWFHPKTLTSHNEPTKYKIPRRL